MTEVFARLDPAATLESARSQLSEAYARIRNDNSGAYPTSGGFSVVSADLKSWTQIERRPLLEDLDRPLRDGDCITVLQAVSGG